MCDKCDLIDYPVADCWRPCYVPPKRERRPLDDVNVQDSGEAYFQTPAAIWAAGHAGARAMQRTDDKKPFEGVE